MSAKKKPYPNTSGVPKNLRNRIVGSGEEAPDSPLLNPKNWRTHSADQEAALEGLLTEVGWVQTVVVNRTTGNLVDGHLRVSLARKRGEKIVPVVYVELSPAEEELVLATLDPLGDLAGIDSRKLEGLLAGLNPDSVALTKLVADLESELGIGQKDDDGDLETLLDQAVQMEPGEGVRRRNVRRRGRLDAPQGRARTPNRATRRLQAGIALRRDRDGARRQSVAPSRSPGGRRMMIAIPSKGRPTAVKSKRILPSASVFVPESEALD
jgi:ParB-like chromosome segregation protein Spo0J